MKLPSLAMDAGSSGGAVGEETEHLVDSVEEVDGSISVFTAEEVSEEEEGSAETDDEAQESEEFEIGKLTQLEGVLLTNVLLEAIQKVAIFMAGIYVHSDVSFVDMSLKYQKPIRAQIFDPDTGQSLESSTEYRTMMKLQKDLSLLAKLLATVRDEVACRGTWGLAGAVAGRLASQRRLERQLEEVYRARKARLAHARSLLHETRRHKKKLSEDKIVRTGKLLDKLQEVSLKAGVEFQYVKKYEAVRTEQNRLVCKRQEQILRIDIGKNNEKIEDEQRVHDTIIKYLEFAIQRLENKTEHWQAKYNKDIEDKDIEIANLKQKRTENAEALQELHDVYKERESEIATFLVVLGEKQRQENEKNRKILAATRIQAWWRGTMVRAQLGPFKPRRFGASPTKQAKDDKKKKKKK